VDWSKFGPEHQIIGQWSEIKMGTEFKYHRNEVVPPLPPKVYDEVIAQGNIHVGNCDSNCRGVNIERFVDRHLQCALQRADIAQRFRKVQETARVKTEGELFHVHFPQKPGTIVRHKGIDYPVEQIVTFIRVVYVESPVEHTAHSMASVDEGTKLLHSFTTDTGGFQFKWVMPEGLKSASVGFSWVPKPDAMPVQASGTMRRPSLRQCEEYVVLSPPALFAAVVHPFVDQAEKSVLD
jgi:hypothetical protein